MSGEGNYIVDDDAVVRISPVSLQSAVCKCHTPHFDYTSQLDTTQLSQSHYNCVDTWACRTASATMPVYFAHDMHTNSAPG